MSADASQTGQLFYGSPDWTSLPPGGSYPPGRNYAFAAFDSARNVDVLFGGYQYENGTSRFFNDTWLFNGTTWAQQNTPTAPSARDGSQMAFDAATGTTILFGGSNGSSVLGDTWSWNGSSWTQLSPATSPPARSEGAMAYDAALGDVVLFGGVDSTGYLGDTWLWNGTTWSLASTSGPSARADAGVAYDSSGTDSSTGDLVLYGGFTSTLPYDSDTWLYGSSGWVQANPAHSPGIRAGEGMAFDRVLNRVIFYGGSTDTSTYEDTWMWNGSDWEEAYVGLVPAYRSEMVFVTAAGHGQIMAYGGESEKGVYYADTNLYDWLDAGGAPGATIESHPTSDRSSFGVNIANGNLVATATDLQVSGVGLDLTFNRVFNDEQPVVGGMVGVNWAFTTADMYLGGLPDGSVVLYGYGGAAGQLYFHYNGSGTFTSPPGIDATMAISGSQYTLTINKTNEKYTFGNSQNSAVLVSDADKNGDAITYSYNSSGQLSTITDTQGRQYQLAYWPSGYLETIADPTGRTITYTQDSNGNLTNVTGPYGNFTYGYGSVGYSSTGLTSIQNPRSNTWNFQFYASVATETVTFPPNGEGGGPTSTSYVYSPPDSTPNGWIKAVSTDANNHATTYIASYAGQAVKTTDALGHSRGASYNANDDIQTATDAMSPGNNATYTYDALNNPTTEQQPTGATNFLAYSNGQAMSAGVTCSTTDSSHPYLPKCSEDAQGHESTYTYDGPGNLLTSTSATAGLQQTNTYNPSPPTCGGKVGQLCSTKDGNGHTTSYHYDTNGNLTTITPPSPLGATTITVDALGRPQTVTDGNGNVTTYSYYTDDQVSQVLTGGATTCSTRTTCTSYVYDNDGNLTSQTDGTGTTSYGYDNLDRQVFTQPPSGQALTLTYDPVGNVSSYTDSGGMVQYTYNQVNELTMLQEPGGAQTTFGYNNDDVRTSTNYPGGTTMAYTPDDSSRPQEVKTTNGSTVLDDFTYTYNARSSDTDLAQTGVDHVASLTTTYGYDGLNRLTNAAQRNGGGTTVASWLYCYDNDGNMTATSTAVGATCPGSTVYTYNNADELTKLNGIGSGWAYDNDGNETEAKGATTRTAEGYSASNQLDSLKYNKTPTTFTYSGLTNTARVSSGSTTFQNGEEALANQTVGGSTTYFTHDPSGTLISERVGGQSYYYIFDGLGNVVGLVNAAGMKVDTYTYTPYGTPTASEAVANPMRYQSDYYDANTGLYHDGARYEDPTLGRFTQLDPSGQTRGYTYAGDDPVNASDPSGEFCLSFSCVTDDLSSAAGVLDSVGGGLIGAFCGESIGGAIGSVYGAGIGTLLGPEGTAGGAAIGEAIGGTIGAYGGAWWGYENGLTGGLAVCGLGKFF